MNNQLLGRIAHNQGLLDGWCTIEKAEVLADTILRLQAKVVVEIGVFGGSSLIPMAMACAEQGFGKVIGIDPWEATAAIEDETKENAEWWAKQDYEAIYQKFLNHVGRLELGPYIEIIRKKSDDVEPPALIDFLHVDGSHTDQASRDVLRYAPNVRVGGVCVMDDVHWTGGGVERAVEKLVGLDFRHVYGVGTGALFERLAPKVVAPAPLVAALTPMGRKKRKSKK